MVETAGGIALEITEQLALADLSRRFNNKVDMVDHDGNRVQCPSPIGSGFSELVQQLFGVWLFNRKETAFHLIARCAM